MPGLPRLLIQHACSKPEHPASSTILHARWVTPTCMCSSLQESGHSASLKTAISACLLMLRLRRASTGSVPSSAFRRPCSVPQPPQLGRQSAPQPLPPRIAPRGWQDTPPSAPAWVRLLHQGSSVPHQLMTSSQAGRPLAQGADQQCSDHAGRQAQACAGAG